MTRVLVVDDEKSIRLTLQAFLMTAGYEVDIAEDAAVARQLLQSQNYDVVVSDIVLPRVSGVELMHIVRQMSPRVQVILMTGEPTVETAAEAVRSGAYDYLSKPVAKAALLRVVGSAARLKAVDDERERLTVANGVYQDSLEQLVDERTRQLEESNRKLQQSVSELRQAQEHMVQSERMNALGQMAGGIAHDFNNALTPILGNAEYFLSRPEAMDDRAQLIGAMKDILTAGEDGREIVRRLREFYRPHDDDQHLPVDVNGVVKTAVNLTRAKWRAEAQASGCEVNVTMELSKVPLVDGTEFELREALTNLILNAVDAMPEGGTVRINTVSEGPWVWVTVADTGTGMSEEVRRRCFEPFFSTKGDRGTGLGLAMVYGIVHRHNGTVDLRSEPGKGAEFKIGLPVYGGEEAEKKPPAPAAMESTVSLNILVVDDEESSRKPVARYLEKSGHRVATAGSGEKALERILGEKFDVVITDRAMPGIGGDEVALAAKKQCGSTRVILLTGFGEMMNGQGEKPDCVDAVLAKPASQERLRQAIRTVMGVNATAR